MEAGELHPIGVTVRSPLKASYIQISIIYCPIQELIEFIIDPKLGAIQLAPSFFIIISERP